MNDIPVTRTSITIPADGEAVQINVAGRRIIVEESPAADPVGVATIHFGSAQGDGIPLIRRASFADRNGWSSFYIRGNGAGAGEEVFLIVLQSVTSLLELPEA